MYLQLAIKGDLAAYTASLARAVEKGARNALRISTFGLRKAVRANITRANFRRKGLSRAIAAKVGEKEGRVYSVARYRAGRYRTVPVDLIALFEQGVTIRAAGGQWLAIPTGEGPRKSGGRGGTRFASPKETQTLGWKTAVIPARGGNMVVVATIAGAHYVTHVLVKQTTLRSRYNLDATVQQWLEKMPLILAGELSKAAASESV